MSATITLPDAPTFLPNDARDDAPEVAPADGGSDSLMGRCPLCLKQLFPRCKITGEPRFPPVGQGYESRAKCSGCGAIIVYCGNGNWRVAEASDFSAEDVWASDFGF